MKNRTMSGELVSSLLAVVASLGVGCSADTGDPSTFVPGPISPTPGMVSVSNAEAAHGWASPTSGTPTTGGAGADPAHTYVVTNREQLVKALYPDAVIAPDGSYTAGAPDTTAKIIYIQGTVSLNTNLAGTELTADDYACEGYDIEAFKTAYDPTTWNRELVDGGPRDILPCPGSQEEFRECSRRRQRAVVQIKVGSNTSIFGFGTNAKIVNGQLIIGGGAPSSGPPSSDLPLLTTDLAEACGIAPPATEPPEPPAVDPAVLIAPTAENVIIRNIAFEDAYDFFPTWDPADSYGDPPEVADATDPFYPQCQLTLDPVDGTGAGPHKCPGGRWNSQFDNITVQNARRVWIDNNTFSDGGRPDSVDPLQHWAAPYDRFQNRFQPHDGLLDINGTADLVTVSRNIFRNHDKVMLIGGSDTVTDRNGFGYLSVTVHHNQFINVGQRTPRVRFGKVHVYNNVIRGTRFPVFATPEDLVNKEMPDYPMGSAITVGHLAKVYSEANVFNITKGHADDPDPTAANLVGLAHREAPAEGLGAGESTYFWDKPTGGDNPAPGSTLQIPPGTAAAVDLNASVLEQVTEDEDPPVLSTDTVWKPADSYSYRAIAAGTVNAELGRLSGAGKIAVRGMPSP